MKISHSWAPDKASGLLLFPAEVGQIYFYSRQPRNCLGRKIYLATSVSCSWGPAVVQSRQVHCIAFDNNPGGLTFLRAFLLTFHRAVSKPLLSFTQKTKVGMIQPAPMFLYWSFHESAFCAWCPALPCFTHRQMGTARSWFLSRQPVHFHSSLYLLKCSPTSLGKRDLVLLGLRGGRRGALLPVPVSALILQSGSWGGKILLCG